MISGFVGRVGTTELIVIFLIVLVIFGPTQLPKLSRTFGQTIGSFKKGMEAELDQTDSDEKKTEDQ